MPTPATRRELLVATLAGERLPEPSLAPARARP
jgi:hypothetical protein